MNRGRAVAAAGCLLLVVTGCGVDSQSDPVVGIEVGHIDRDVRCWTMDGATASVSSVADVLPNTLFDFGKDAKPRPLTPLVVVGRIVEVTEGPAWRGAEGHAQPDGHDGVVVPFDDPRALWKFVHATVEVDELLSGAESEAPATVTVTFTLDGDESLTGAREQLLTGQTLVLPLYQWAGTDYDPTVWAVGPSNGSLVMEVHADGSLSLPCVSMGEASRLTMDVDTLRELRLASEEPEQVRTVAPVALA